MKQVRIVAFSDIHGELDFKLPSGDIAVIAGDICPCRGSHSPTAQMFWLNDHFLPWCDRLIQDGMYSNIVFIAGNHDFVFKKVVNFPGSNFHFVLPPNVHYLQDSMIELMGVKIYGTPWTPTFGRWAYMRDDADLDEIYAKIPEGLDILLSHGPAKTWGDIILKGPYSDERGNLGSESLRKHVVRAKPRHFLYGHLHEASHTVASHNIDFDDMLKCTTSVCVSLLNDHYEMEYAPYTFSIFK